VEFVRDRLLPRATEITPNLREAAALTGLKVEDVDNMKLAACKLIELCARCRGNRQPSGKAGGRVRRQLVEFARTCRGPHQTREYLRAACTFSSALAARLALGHRLDEAIILAKAYVTETIRRAYPVGDGRIPLNQLYRLQVTDSQPSFAKPVQR